MKPDISVVIPTYKRTELLMRCLQALTDQTLEEANYEVIVVSDGPDMKTREAVQIWKETSGQNVSFHHLEERKGPAAARNRGWQHAKGRLIAFTDDDCIPDARWLESFAEAYRYEDQLVLSGKVIVPLPEVPTDFELNTSHLETAEFITANCACSRAVLLQTGGFDERFAQAWREDSDFQFRVIREAIPLRKLDTAIVVHPVRSAQWGVSIYEQRKGMYDALLYKKFPDFYDKRIGSRAPWNYYAMILFFIAGIYGLLAGSAFSVAAGFGCWLLLVAEFSVRRLRNTSRSLKHVSEMLATSALIPFLSVYWQLYGAWKYRVLFI
ncbi:GT2 family glycosyltransferase [Arcticibacter pallidicorallinus]|uniref:GT2 family glycosyltransferase n=1 Tax=Arcticibacter pallidicorallinus TaxID=1259464 RepID=A0A2T0U9L3_9SPHI|nr:glycosyltransferase [Arcticibacter pallidicorallinus]PRY54604.1 GT2 family glycosyltransferase [Arcticibacter pallidicorallinus]